MNRNLKNILSLPMVLTCVFFISSCSKDEVEIERPEKVYYDQAQRRIKVNNYFGAIESLQRIETQYPFGKYDYNDTIEGMKDWFDLARMNPEEYPPETFAEFFNKENSALVKHNKQWDNRDNRWRNFNWLTDVAYHLDAEKFAEYLRDEYCDNFDNRFTHIRGEVRGSVKDIKPLSKSN